MKAAALLDFVPFRVFTAHASDPQNPHCPKATIRLAFRLDEEKKDLSTLSSR
jgi:hypothetical protein